MKEIKYLIIILLAEAFAMCALSAIAMVPIWFFWNQAAVCALNLPRITVWDAFCLHILYNCFAYFKMRSENASAQGKRPEKEIE